MGWQDSGGDGGRTAGRMGAGWQGDGGWDGGALSEQWATEELKAVQECRGQEIAKGMAEGWEPEPSALERGVEGK